MEQFAVEAAVTSNVSAMVLCWIKEDHPLSGWAWVTSNGGEVHVCRCSVHSSLMVHFTQTARLEDTSGRHQLPLHKVRLRPGAVLRVELHWQECHLNTSPMRCSDNTKPENHDPCILEGINVSGDTEASQIIRKRWLDRSRSRHLCWAPKHSSDNIKVACSRPSNIKMVMAPYPCDIWLRCYIVTKAGHGLWSLQHALIHVDVQNLSPHLHLGLCDGQRFLQPHEAQRLTALLSMNHVYIIDANW